MNMEAVLKERIMALESILANLECKNRSRYERYQEKCDSYRRILADIVREEQHDEKTVL